MMTDFDFYNLEANLNNTFYFVEADSFAMHALWVMYVSRPYSNEKRVEWGEISRLFVHTHNNTAIRFAFAWIHGKLVCFFSPSGIIVNWNDIDEFLKPFIKTSADGYRRRKTDAMNFHHCVEACKSE